MQDTNRPVVFGVGPGTFNSYVFITQFLLHMVPIFALFLSPNPRVQGFHLNDPRAVVNYLPIIFMWTAIITYALSPDDLSHGVYIPVALLICHRLMIALKYATMTESEYRRVIPPTSTNPSDEDIQQAVVFMNQSQIISGLLGENRELLEYQVANATAELGMNIAEMYIVVPKKELESDKTVSPANSWEVFISDALSRIYNPDPSDKDRGNGFSVDRDFLNIHNEIHKLDEGESGEEYIKIPVALLAMALVGRAGKSYLDVARIVGRFGKATSVLIVLQPFIVLINNPVPASAVNVLYFISTTVLTLLFANVLSLFLSGCFYEALRKRAVASKLSDMLELRAVCYGASLRRVQWLYDRKKGHTDYLFSDSFQDRKNEHVIRQRFSQINVSRYRTESLETAAVPALLEKITSKMNADSDTDGDIVGESTRDTLMNVEDTGVESTRVMKPPMPVMKLQPNNALAFLTLRQIMKIYGKRLSKRLDVFIGALAQVLVVLMVVVVVLMATSSEPSQITQSALFWMVLLIVLMFSGSMVAVILVGGIANANYSDHREIIAGHQHRVHSRVVSRNAALQDYREIEALYKEKRVALCRQIRHTSGKNSVGGLSTTPKTSASMDSDDDDDDAWVDQIQPVLTEDIKSMKKLQKDLKKISGHMKQLEAEQAEDDHLMEILDYVADSIELTDEFHPIKFIGMECTFELAYSLFSTVLTFFGYVIAASSGAVGEGEF